MKERALTIAVGIYAGAGELEEQDAGLLDLARKATGHAYAPYSRFRVAAAVRLVDGQTITGTNQENASFPAGICAERVALSAAAALYPDAAVSAVAISYLQEGRPSDTPISPCGICRQTLIEYELRFGHPIRVIMGGERGEVFVVKSAADLLPLAFTAGEMG